MIDRADFQTSLFDVDAPALRAADAMARDLWVAGYLAGIVDAAGPSCFDTWHAIDRVITQGEGLRYMGNGIEKSAYLAPSGERVIKLTRQQRHACKLPEELDAIQDARAAGLPVPYMVLVHDRVALVENCPALNTLEYETRLAYADQVMTLAEEFEEAIGVYDAHDGNFGVRSDGTLVMIDLGHRHSQCGSGTDC
jgi:hypothetical protein